MEILVRNAVISYRLAAGPNASISPTVVFLHGWERTAADFDALRERLANTLPNVSFLQFDLPGFGNSRLPQQEGISPAEYVQIAKELLDKLGLEKAVLIGHSFGGMLAVRFAAAFPDRVEKIVLIAAGEASKRSRRSRVIVRLARLANFFLRPILDISPGLEQLQERLARLLRSRDYQNATPLLRKTLALAFAEDIRPYAARLTHPALIIWGTRDQETPLADAKTYHTLIKNSRLEILEGDHFVFLEQGERCADLIRSFLQNA
ncbi:MAG: alpha/beta hydrolase [Candidatus Sungbacteria bacterium]|nr:alpha/beta hydrolase [Candidatus Sungbacteria bacterium]